MINNKDALINVSDYAPYIIKDGIRIYRDTLNLVSDKIKIVAIPASTNQRINGKTQPGHKSSKGVKDRS